MADVYVQDNGNGTFSVVERRNDGTYYAPFTGSKQDAEQAYNTMSNDAGWQEGGRNWLMGQTQKTPANTTSRNANSWNTGGPDTNLAAGYGQYNDYMQQLAQADNLRYLERRLDELDIPMSQVERAQLISQLTGYYMPGTAPQAMSNTQALDWIAGTRDNKFWDFFKASGWTIETPEQKRAAVQEWINKVDPKWKGMSASEVAQKLGAEGAAGGFAGGYAGQKGALPTFTREQWNEANRQWQNQFDTGREQYALNMLERNSGPTDYWKWQQMMPKGAYGEVQPGQSWEQLFADYWNRGRSGAAALPGQGTPPGQATVPIAGTQTVAAPTVVPFDQPIKITPQQWNQKGPTGQAMTAGAWSYWGQPPEEMARQMKAAWPTGQAAENTYWR